MEAKYMQNGESPPVNGYLHGHELPLYYFIDNETVTYTSLSDISSSQKQNISNGMNLDDWVTKSHWQKEWVAIVSK